MLVVNSASVTSLVTEAFSCSVDEGEVVGSDLACSCSAGARGRDLLAEELQRRLRVQRLREVVALPELASQFAQPFDLSGSLNAFGNHAQIHLVSQGDDQFDDVG